MILLRLFPAIIRCPVVLCLSLVVLNVYGQQAAPVEQRPITSAITLRIGVVAYEDFQLEHARFQQWLNQVSASSNPPIRFQLTTGSYSEIAHWMKQGSIDAALITGGGFATLGVLDQDTDEFEYIATLDSQSATGPWATESRRSPGFHGLYHSVCITNVNSTISSAADLAAFRALEFVCQTQIW